MGIEAISGITGAVSYTAQTVPAAKTTDAYGKSSESAQPVQSAVTSQPVVMKQVEAKAQGGRADADQQDGQSKEQEEGSMKNVAKDMNKLINQNTIAEFGYHEDTHRITIKIKDKDTDEVIKEIPSEKALEMLKKAWELAGILVDEKR